jgi:prolipoprotein diacylglyceryl transferase
MSSLALWGVPGGLIGARVYSLATSWNVDTQGVWYRSFEIWKGGLGIWGGVVGGIGLGLVGVYRHRLPMKAALDCVSPAFAIGQAIGRWGNYFNQELYGRPSKLPWAVKIDNPPAPYAAHSTFQPTFLYEFFWDLGVVLFVIWVERRFRIRRGYLFAVYAAAYTAGRFWIEYLRIDDAHRYLGLRLNDWTSIIVFVAAVTILVLRGRAGEDDDRAGIPIPGLSGPPPGADPDPAPRTDTHDDDDGVGPDPRESDAVGAEQTYGEGGAGRVPT